MNRSLTFIITLMFCAVVHAQQKTWIVKMQDGEKLRKEGKYTEALTLLTQAEQDTAMMNNTQRYFLYSRMAACYKATADYVRSSMYYDRIEKLPISQTHLDQNTMNKCGLHLLMGQYETALTQLRKLKFSDEDDEAERLINLATALTRTQQIDSAIIYLKKVQEQLSEKKNRTYITATSNLGYTYWQKKDYRQAEKEIMKAIGLYDTNDAEGYVCLSNLAIVEAHLKKNTALQHIDKAIEWIKNKYTENHPDYIIMLRKRAEVLLLLGEKEKAVTAFRDFFKREKQYVFTAFPEMTMRQRQNYSKMEQSLLAKCYATEDADPDFLYDVALFGKSMLLLENNNSDIKSQLSTSVDDIRRSLDKRSDVAIEMIRYVKNGEMWYAALVVQKDKAVRFVPLFSENEINNYALHGNSRLYGQLKKAVCAYGATGNKQKNSIYTDEALGNKIWEPILAGINGKADIYFSPEGIFHLLSIENLPSKYSKNRFYRLSSTKSVCNRKSRNGHGTKTLCVGGVRYNDASMVETRSATPPDRRGSYVMEQDRMLPAPERGFPYLKGSLQEVTSISSSLPADSYTLYSGKTTTEELLKKEIRHYPRVLISTHGFCSTIGDKKNAPADEDLITEDLTLLRCGIILAGADYTAQQIDDNQFYEDGILTAQELSTIDLRQVDLFVLSACQTALGSINEDGLVGLPQGLKKAGVGSVVASLWEVDDQATKMLMTEFFRQLNNGKKTVSDAMAKAQQYIKKQTKVKTTIERSTFSTRSLRTEKGSKTIVNDYSLPQYWAPFIVIDGIF